MDATIVLSKIPLFKSLDAHELETLRSRCTIRSYPAETLVVSEGAEGDALYVVLEGAVKIFLANNSGRKVILGVEWAGGYFGEIAILDRAPRSASVTTITQARMLSISRHVVRDILQRHPDVAHDIIAALTARVRSLTDTVRSLVVNDVKQRVVVALIRLAESDGELMVIPKRPPHRDIADMIGASREMVGRVLRALIDSGDITIEGCGMVLHPAAGEFDEPVNDRYASRVGCQERR
jgi:CRP/FNR family transcriptional regulator, cyclic AMP receptor protein